MKNLLFVLLTVLSVQVFSQGVAINDDGTAPNSNSILDIDDTRNDKGILIPRMTTIQRNAIVGLAVGDEGLTVYDETTNCFWLWDGAAWVQFATGANNDWKLTGNTGTDIATDFIGTTDSEDFAIRSNNNEIIRVQADGDVGIGDVNPTHKLSVYSTDYQTMHLYSNGTNGAGARLTFGDNGYVYIDELTDDELRIHATGDYVMLDGSEVRIGTGSPTISSFDDGDLYVTDDVEIDDDVTIAGQLAINTTTQNGLLHLYGGDLNITESTSKMQASLTDDGALELFRSSTAGSQASANGYIDFKSDNTHDADFRMTYNNTSGTNGALEFTSTTDGSIASTGVARFVILNSNGNTGIDDINPGQKLEVNGFGRFGDRTNGNVTIGGTGTASIELRESDGSGTPFIDFSNDNTSDYDARLILSNDNMLTLNGAGLSVSGGTIQTSAFIATTAGAGAYKYNTSTNMNVPDYVFDKYYNGFSKENPIYEMSKLENVEAFLKENHHLPRVPSRTEILNEGAINLQGMQMITLEKLEELYLYTIEQEKKIKKYEKQISEILKRLDALE